MKKIIKYSLYAIYICSIFTLSVYYEKYRKVTYAKEVKQWVEKATTIKQNKYNIDKSIILMTMSFIAKQEGLKYEAYNGAGHKEKAICFGNSYKHFVNKFLNKNKATLTQCIVLLKNKITQILSLLQKNKIYFMHNTQYVSIISLVYNIGWNAFINSNLYQYIVFNDNTEHVAYNTIQEWLDINRVSKQHCIKKHCIITKYTECGLIKRRAEEIILYFSETPEPKKAYATKALKHILNLVYIKNGICVKTAQSILQNMQ